MSDNDDLITDLARRVQDKYYGKYRGFVANNGTRINSAACSCASRRYSALR